MICENCGIDHDGSYGSGRFCSSKCARGFSTKGRREEINKKVSESLSGRKSWVPKEKRSSYKFSNEDRKKARIAKNKVDAERIINKIHNGEYVRNGTVKPVILKEQNGVCAICGMEPIWMGNPLSFDLDHIDGNKYNSNRDNLRVICPHCHRQTKTFCGKNIGRYDNIL